MKLMKPLELGIFVIFLSVITRKHPEIDRGYPFAGVLGGADVRRRGGGSHVRFPAVPQIR